MLRRQWSFAWATSTLIPLSSLFSAVLLEEPLPSTSFLNIKTKSVSLTLLSEISFFLVCWIDCGEYLYMHRRHGAVHPPFSQTPLPTQTVPSCQTSHQITLFALVLPICCYATSGITKKRFRRSPGHPFSFSLPSRPRFLDDHDVTYEANGAFRMKSSRQSTCGNCGPCANLLIQPFSPSQVPAT